MSGTEYHRRTAITRLTVSEEDETLLRDTVSAWKRGCQVAADSAWGKCRSPFEVQKLAYDDEAIRRTVDAALDELRALDADYDGLTAFLDDAEYHRAVVVTILQRRRDAIETIMQDKFSR